MKKKLKRSPLKSKPLRNPGQSLDEEIQKILDDQFNSYAYISGICVVIAVLEWYKWYKHLPPQPVLWTIVAVGVFSYSAFRIAGLFKRIKKLKQGRDGEKAVGQFLESLRTSGCRVFHDVIGEGFNIDHVVLSEHGIYVLETKTYSKPARGEPVVLYQGDSLLVDGYNTDGAPIRQVKAEAAEIKKILKISTGKDYPVKPVVLFPGWYIKPKNANNNKEVWVLNPKALPRFIEKQPQAITTEDLKLATFHLSRYIRSL